ncbi:variant SH3 domain-containing protein [Hirsutella rhossiliensis]|uniref:Variant SH3 domain-containing protein n=1 Tax=Hirsutella rhossiliensis TaxID=111463 RepID=A0A9P8MLF5_9HYPO|nr:variant SH3 domain-containing protein [Hirsutella rhossiliensis]KAH0957295.1 variant SH3 domain-containing protein [Hirsutella rhossiliensis]
MASLNLSINGPSIKSSYNGVVSGPPPPSSSPTYAHGAKESILKVESTGDGELVELIEDFNEGRIQFAFVKVKDPNTALPNHAATVSKILHGYHIQITARSDSDLEVDSIMKKVSDASGAKYSAASSGGMAPAAPPPVKSKPVFTPTASSAGRSANPLVAARSRRDEGVDDDVNMAELTKQKPEAPRFDGGRPQDNGSEDVVKGAYQPVGKVDIAAIRAAAKNKGDDRPTPVKGTYEPIGKVDIAAIRAKAQKPADASTDNAQSPKPPKVANKFGGASAFTGTKAPTPGGAGFGVPGASTPAPVGSTSRTFADEGGKTPAQIWAEKKARQRGSDSGAGEWKSGYTGKSWAPVQAPGYSRAALSQDNTGEADRGAEGGPDSPSGGVSALRDRFKNVAPIGSGTAPPVPQSAQDEAEPSPAPPPVSDNSRSSGGFALPGLPNRPPPPTDEEDEESDGQPSPIRAPPPVPPSQIDVPREDELPDEEEAVHSAREAAGGKRAVIQYDYEKAEDNEIELIEGEYVTNIDMVDDDWWMGTNSRGESGLFPSNYVELVADDDHGSSAAAPAAPSMPEPAHATEAGPTATALYDYEAAEDNELSFPEDAKITNLEFPDEDWWFGSFQGQSGLFPANYVQLDA